MPEKLLNALAQRGLPCSLPSPLPTEEGWSVDSALLENTPLSEEDLLEALAAASQLKPVNLNHFYPDFSLAKLLLPEWCQQNGCVPLCEEDEALHVAVSYPPKLQALEEFSLLVGRKLLPWVAVECRIQQWLASLYGLPLPKRTSALLEKRALPKPPPKNKTIPPAENTPAPPPPPSAAPPNTPPSNVFRDFFVKIKQLFPKQELPPPPQEKAEEKNTTSPFSAVDEGLHLESLLEELLANQNPPPPPTAPEENPQPLPWLVAFKSYHQSAPNWTLEEARSQLQLAQNNRDKLTEVLLGFGLSAFEFVGLFSVLHGKAQGFACAGKGAQESFLRARVELSSGFFHAFAQNSSAYFGPPPNEPSLQRLLGDIHRRPRALFLFPISVKNKLVAIFYGDSGQSPLKQKPFADFNLFCQQLPAAFHELLWLRRKQPPPPELDEAALLSRLHLNLPFLFEANVARQNAAMEILAQTPEASAKALVSLFPGPHSSLLNEDESPASLHTLGPVAHALLQLGDAGALALAPLLFSKDKKLRLAALKLAGVFASPELLEPVLLALSDADAQIASTARAVLPHFKTLNEWPQALHLIQHSLSVRDPLRRILAAKAVVAAKDRGSIETLIEWTGDSEAWVAETAAWALQQLSCIQLGPSPNLWKKWWAHAQHKRRVEWLVLALESEEFEQRKQAIEELSEAIGDTFCFAADAPEEERLPAVQRWQQFVAQHPNFEL